MSTAQSGLFAPVEIAAPESPFGVSELLQLLHRRGRTVLQVATAVVVLAALVLIVWPTRYSTTAVVMLDPRKNNVTDRSQVLTGLPTDPVGNLRTTALIGGPGAVWLQSVCILYRYHAT